MKRDWFFQFSLRQGFATNPFACRLFPICLHPRVVASLSALGIERYCLFPVVVHRTFSSLLLLASAIDRDSIDMKGKATTPIPRSAIAISTCRNYPISCWNRLKVPGCNRRTIFFWISSSSCGRTGQLDRRSLFRRPCLRANTKSGDITVSPADECHFGTFDRRILLFWVSILHVMLVTEFCQQSTVGLESNQSGEELNFTFPLKKGNVTNMYRWENLLRPMPSFVRVVTVVQRTDDTSLSPCCSEGSWKYTSLIYETRQFALNRLEQTTKSVTRTMRSVVYLQNEIYWAMTQKKLTLWFQCRDLTTGEAHHHKNSKFSRNLERLHHHFFLIRIRNNFESNLSFTSLSQFQTRKEPTSDSNETLDQRYEWLKNDHVSLS